MSPYPAGIELPDLDSRPSCTDLWPPVFAAADAVAVGDWSIVTRRDGRKQWAFKEQPVYTSARDRQPAGTCWAARPAFTAATLLPIACRSVRRR